MSQAPADADAKRCERRRLLMEIGVVAGLYWLPSAWSGLHSYVRHLPQPQSWTTEVSRAIYSAGSIALVLFVLWRAQEPLSRFGFVRPTRAQLLVGVGLLAAMFCSHVLFGVGRWIFQLDPEWLRAGMPPHLGPMRPIPSLLIVVPINALAEEVICRAYLATRLMDLWNSKVAAVLLSAAMFSVWHSYQGWPGLAATFVDGVVFASVFLKTRSIWSCAIAHSGHNILAGTNVVTGAVSRVLHAVARV